MKGLSQFALTAVVGIILGIVGTYIVLVQRITRAEDSIAVLEKRPVAAVQELNSSDPAVSAVVRPERLQGVIQAEQKKYVRESYGQEAGQCFTQDDLDSFVKENRLLQIVAELRHSNDFLDLAVGIKMLAPSDRQHLLDASRGLSHPTWRELGRISPQGQTDAGQKAELLIAGAIVAEIERLIQLPDGAIKKLYT